MALPPLVLFIISFEFYDLFSIEPNIVEEPLLSSSSTNPTDNRINEQQKDKKNISLLFNMTNNCFTFKYRIHIIMIIDKTTVFFLINVFSFTFFFCIILLMFYLCYQNFMTQTKFDNNRHFRVISYQFCFRFRLLFLMNKFFSIQHLNKKSILNQWQKPFQGFFIGFYHKFFSNKIKQFIQLHIKYKNFFLFLFRINRFN